MMKNYLLILLSIFILISCTLDAEFGLPNTQKIDDNLIGKWVYSEKDTLELKKHNPNQYILSLDNNDFVAYSNTIKNHQIVSIIENIQDKTSYIFYAYKISGDSLEVFDINKDFKTKAFSSEIEVLTFFENNLGQPDFLIEPMKLIRVNN